jgi:hypothetical protein
VMTCVVGRGFVVFCQVSAVVSCWALRWLAACAEPFARIVHASCGA